MDPDPRQQVTEYDHGTLPEDIFLEFKARRGAILKALTTDEEKFYQECDPEKEELSLYGYIDGNWQVTVPPDQYVPLDLPKPVVGINFARDGMPRKEWLALVAVHSDSWLLSVSFFYAAKCEFDMRSRSKLFELINSLPTLYQIVNPRENKTCYCTSKANKADPKSSKPTTMAQAPPLAQRKQEDIKDMDKKERVKEEEENNVSALTQRKDEEINHSKKRKRAKEEEEDSDVPPPTRRKKEGINNMKGTKRKKENKTSNGCSKLNKADPKSSNPTKVSQAPPPAQRKEEGMKDMDKMEAVKRDEESKLVLPPAQRKEDGIKGMDKMEGVKQDEVSKEDEKMRALRGGGKAIMTLTTSGSVGIRATAGSTESALI